MKSASHLLGQIQEIAEMKLKVEPDSLTNCRLLEYVKELRPKVELLERMQIETIAVFKELQNTLEGISKVV